MMSFSGIIYLVFFNFEKFVYIETIASQTYYGFTDKEFNDDDYKVRALFRKSLRMKNLLT